MDDNDVEKSSAQRKVLVVGGGLAGITAASELADGGYQVDLLERRPYLGGRTYSFTDKKNGSEVDNGQHVFMKCCTYYIDLLKRLGVLDKTYLQERLSVKVVGAEGRASVLSGSRLPSPLHLLPSLLTYRHLSWSDKLRIGYAAASMRRISEGKRRGLDNVTFYDWLMAHRQSERSIDNFWNLVILPTLNDDARAVSAAQAIMIFQVGFLADPHAADMGYAKVGLSTLLVDEASRYIEARDGRLILGQSAARLDGTVEGIDSVTTHGGAVHQADAYILAVPPNKLLGLLPPALQEHEFFRKAASMAMSPIVNVYLWLDRKVTDSSFAAYLDSELQWLFNKSEIHGMDGGSGQYLCISLSAAHKYIDMPQEALYTLMIDELHRHVPASREATVLHYTIVKERYATFTASPGSAANRLPSRTPVPNLFLAGAWTDTGWPSTMESAVRSGIFAARETMRAP